MVNTCSLFKNKNPGKIYFIWQTQKDDGKSEACGICMMRDGKIYDHFQLPPHKNCKCIQMPLQLYVMFDNLESKINALERRLYKNIVDKNIAKTKNMTYKEWLDSVRNNGQWDYKRQNRNFTGLGNFNYGATGRAMGIPATVLKMGAGAYQVINKTSSWDFIGSYGDDPVDQDSIQNGIDYYDENYGDE